MNLIINTGSVQEMWEAALGELQLQVSKPNYRTWLEKTNGLSYHDNQFVVGVPNTFVAEYLDKNQRSLIEKTLIGLAGGDIRVAFHVNGKHSESSGDGQEENSPTKKASRRFNQKYTFNSFITGGCNRLAQAAAISVAQKPGSSYNPLFIHGEAGLGKTHLLHAIGHVAFNNHCNVLYTSAEGFTNEFVNALRGKTIEEFHNKYRTVDILLIDDIHFIIGKEQTEESFFHTFNELHNTNRQIVITSDRSPEALKLMDERMRSRFEWGLITGIQPPDNETCISILRSKAKQRGVIVPQDVLEFIAARNSQNVRRLEGALNRVIAYAALVQTSPTYEMAVQALKDIARQEPPQHAVSPGTIIEYVAETFQTSAAELRSKKRDKETTLARHLAMYIVRQETPCSLAQIGREMGGRDHSTVTHACDSIARSVDANPYLKRKLVDIQRKLHQNS